RTKIAADAPRRQAVPLGSTRKTKVPSSSAKRTAPRIMLLRSSWTPEPWRRPGGASKHQILRSLGEAGSRSGHPQFPEHVVDATDHQPAFAIEREAKRGHFLVLLAQLNGRGGDLPGHDARPRFEAGSHPHTDGKADADGAIHVNVGNVFPCRHAAAIGDFVVHRMWIAGMAEVVAKQVEDP